MARRQIRRESRGERMRAEGAIERTDDGLGRIIRFVLTTIVSVKTSVRGDCGAE